MLPSALQETASTTEPLQEAMFKTMAACFEFNSVTARLSQQSPACSLIKHGQESSCPVRRCRRWCVLRRIICRITQRLWSDRFLHSSKISSAFKYAWALTRGRCRYRIELALEIAQTDPGLPASPSGATPKAGVTAQRNQSETLRIAYR
jgi:hypothetical protein